MARQAKRNVRGLPSGAGASGSLVAAAAVAFVGVTGLVAVDEMPFGADGGEDGSIALQGTGSAPLVAGPGGGGPSGVVVLDTPAPADGGGTEPGAAPAGPGTAPGPGPGAGLDAGISPPSSDATAPPAAGGPALAPSVVPNNPIGDAVAGVDSTIEGATGVDPGLGGATRPLTTAVDQAVQGLTGGGVGGSLGNLAGGSVP